MTLDQLNALPKPALADALRTCCGAKAWVQGMLSNFPVPDADTLMDDAKTVWFALAEDDWREAFRHHPKIGQDVESLRQKFASTAQWAAGEQRGVQAASDETLRALAAGNTEYEQKFGYIFIVFATGKTANEMLALLQARLLNKPDDEIREAAAEQDKITRLRLEKLLAP
jgi:2-oxo-4-hydroxy-4-carboxy-5-ureidoimidazoline decarboxylase